MTGERQLWGHEGQFPPPRLSGRSAFGEQTFAGRCGNDQARSRAYHWGEDGLAGFSDDQQRLCFALALWKGKDPILKEPLFGLTGSEGNEDVKEYYFYLDNRPTHSYMKYLYKYPQTPSLQRSHRSEPALRPHRLEIRITGYLDFQRRSGCLRRIR